jgi:hypothetical protein
MEGCMYCYVAALANTRRVAGQSQEGTTNVPNDSQQGVGANVMNESLEVGEGGAHVTSILVEVARSDVLRSEQPDEELNEEDLSILSYFKLKRRNERVSDRVVSTVTGRYSKLLVVPVPALRWEGVGCSKITETERPFKSNPNPKL